MVPAKHGNNQITDSEFGFDLEQTDVLYKQQSSVY